MESLYSQTLTEKCAKIILTDDESKHVKALRLKIGNKVLITNGRGLTAFAIFNNYDKSTSEFLIEKFEYNLHETHIKVNVAIGLLDNKERFEFALEKAVEIGCSEFTPLITRYSNSRNFNLSRLQAKAIAAIKQSKRSILPKINLPQNIKDIDFEKFDQIILADENGKNNITLRDNILLLIGPEGGFSEEEINLIFRKNADLMKLGQTRLRAETALIAALSKILL